jgi:hypothetical protein
MRAKRKGRWFVATGLFFSPSDQQSRLAACLWATLVFLVFFDFPTEDDHTAHVTRLLRRYICSGLCSEAEHGISFPTGVCKLVDMLADRGSVSGIDDPSGGTGCHAPLPRICTNLYLVSTMFRPPDI